MHAQWNKSKVVSAASLPALRRERGGRGIRDYCLGREIKTDGRVGHPPPIEFRIQTIARPSFMEMKRSNLGRNSLKR